MRLYIMMFRHLSIRGISSAGRAFGWQPKGQGFKSPILHLKTRGCPRVFLLCKLEDLTAQTPFLLVTMLA